MQFKKTTLNTAMATVLGVSGMAAMEMAAADSIDMNYSGAFTMLTSLGAPLLNTETQNATAPFYNGRTPITGTMTFNLDNFTGSGTVNSFSFFSGGAATATTVTFTAIGDGFGNPGTLVLGNMGFNWSGNAGIPLSIVLDAQGLFGALTNGFTVPASVNNVSVSQTLSGSGALAATETTTFGTTMNNYTIPLGPSPIVSTTFNTTNIGSPTLGTNPSGTLPLTDDGIGGSPFQQAVPFNGFNGNFDITTIHISAVNIMTTEIPVPAAVWLFGSGLIGLVGVARRRQKR